MYMFAISQYGTSYVTAVYDITEICEYMEYEVVDKLCVDFVNVVNSVKGMGPVRYLPGQRSERPAHELLSRGITWYENKINVNLLGGDCYFVFFEDISEKEKISRELNSSVYYSASSTSEKGKHTVEVLGDKLASLCTYVYLFDDKVVASRDMDMVFATEDRLNDYNRYIVNSLSKLRAIHKFIKNYSNEKMVESATSYGDVVYADATGVLLLIEGILGVLSFAKRFNKASYAKSLLNDEERINVLFDRCESIKKKLRLMNVYMGAAVGSMLESVSQININDESDLKIVIITEAQSICRYKGIYNEALREMSKRENLYKLASENDEYILNEFKKRLTSTFKYLYAERFLDETWENPTNVNKVFEDEILSKLSFKVAHTIDEIYATPNEDGRVLNGDWYDIKSGVTMGLLIKEFK